MYQPRRDCIIDVLIVEWCLDQLAFNNSFGRLFSEGISGWTVCGACHLDEFCKGITLKDE